MASTSLDMALDDLIKSKRPTTTRGRGGRGGNNSLAPRRGGGIMKSPNAPTRQGLRSAGNRSQPYSVPRAGGLVSATGGEGSKILISNLDFNVTEADLKELFETRVGPLKKVALNYDANGRSKGSATIHFSRARDAAVAYDKYHNVTLDGRAMKIEILLNPTVALLSQPALTTPIVQNVRAQNQPAQRGGNASRGRGSRGRGGNKRSDNRKPKTAEELDQEMTEYMNVDDGPSA